MCQILAPVPPSPKWYGLEITLENCILSKLYDKSQHKHYAGGPKPLKSCIFAWFSEVFQGMLGFGCAGAAFGGGYCTGAAIVALVGTICFSYVFHMFRTFSYGMLGWFMLTPTPQTPQTHRGGGWNEYVNASPLKQIHTKCDACAANMQHLQRLCNNQH